MLIRDFLARPARPALAVGLALLLSALASQARAELSAPVQAIRRALAEPLPTTEDPKELEKALDDRKKALQQLIDDKSKLQDMGDMTQALLLPSWSESSSSVSDTSKVDRDAYKVLLTRLLNTLRDEIKAADAEPAIRAAVVTLVGEFGASARSGLSGQRNRLLLDDMPQFTQVVADVAEKDRSPEVRAAAAASLAKIQSDPAKDMAPQPVTVPALEAMLKDSNSKVRRAAAMALGDLLRGTRSADRGGYAASPVVEPSPENLSVFGPQVAKAAGAVLSGKESDAEVRRLAAEALVQVATTLKGKLRPTAIDADLHPKMRPIIDALWDQTAALDRASRDDDTRVRHTALRALEEMGEARQVWLAPASETIRTLPLPEKPKGGPTKPPRLGLETLPDDTNELTLAVAQAQPVKPKDEPPALADAIPALVSRLRDDSVRNRLAALDAMESITARTDDQRTLAQDLGAKPAADAARAVTRALGDPDRFVRWAAARTLGEMAPLGDVDNAEGVERGAVGGLARLLSDRDPDVRMRSAIAVERFGKGAREAVPALALAATNRGDLEARISAVHAIEVIGGHAAEAVPALAEGLGDSNVRLRRIAAEALATYGPDAAPAKPALNRALFDSDPEVRREASEALLKIGAKR